MEPSILVAEWLRSLQHGSQAEQQDEVIHDYIVNALTVCAQDGDDAELSDLDDALTGLCEAYAQLPDEERLDSLSHLFMQVQSCLKARAKEQAAEQAAVAASMRAQSAGSSARRTSESGTSSSAPSNDDMVEQLLALCSGQIGTEFARHMLREEFRGDLEAAADFVLDAGDGLAAKEAAFQQRQADLEERRLRDEAAKERNRQAIIARFALQEVKPKNASCKKGPVKDTLTPALWADEDKPKFRYCDGVAVPVKKGQKYVIEKTQEEWDGGSKGKVYTKGKRGKGFT